MKASIKIKSTLASLLQSAGFISRKLGRYSNHGFALLMYHRVIPKEKHGGFVQAGMVVEPGTFDLHIRYLREYFEIIPLSDLASHHHIHARNSRKKPLCVLTFDDGWYDFYEYAYPILKTHEVPAIVFLPTNFIGTDQWFWTDRLGFLLDRMIHSWNIVKDAPIFQDPLLGQVVQISGTHEKRLERTINLLKPYSVEEIERILSELTTVLGEDSIPVGRAFLSWEEVREMLDSGLVSFGSHTAGHPILTTLTDKEAQDELTKSMDVLKSQQIVDPAFVAFSYPNGGFTDKLSEMVRNTGYHLAVTTQDGWNQWGENVFQLKRIAIHQDMTSTEAMFGSRVINLF